MIQLISVLILIHKNKFSPQSFSHTLSVTWRITTSYHIIVTDLHPSSISYSSTRGL